MEDVRSRVQPFALRPTVESTWARAALGVALPAVERLLGLTELGHMYTEATGAAVVDDFPERALAYLDIRWHAAAGSLDRVPTTGPLIIVSNHPFGAVDGLVLLALLRRVRPDVRLLGNYLLQRIPELRQLLIEVDPFGGEQARATNRSMLRRAVDWTRRGGAVVVFPAGEVSSVGAPGGRLVDIAWRFGVERLAIDGAATVLPVFFSGRNSRTFEMAGRVHPRLRTALLPRELLNMRGQTVAPVIGSPVPYDRLASLPDAAARVAYLRARTYALDATPVRTTPAVSEQSPVARSASADVLAQEVARLPAERRLGQFKALDVFVASAHEIPEVLQEIGRLREVTFRAVGEGTGQSLDLDRFDESYWHLFVWQRDRREVVGAYRVGPTDQLVKRHGLAGLYTHTLFRFDRRLLRRLGPALELGRSFVRPEYQREFGALKLLWQGIGSLAARHPRYRVLFGPVSISAAYGGVARDLLADALIAPDGHGSLAGLVRARRPYRPHVPGPRSPLSTDLAEVNRVLTDVEPDGKGMPVLLRQYLKLQARVLALSTDPGFSDVVDAFLVVDLDQVDRASLTRYMGKDGAGRFLANRP